MTVSNKYGSQYIANVALQWKAFGNERIFLKIYKNHEQWFMTGNAKLKKITRKEALDITDNPEWEFVEEYDDTPLVRDWRKRNPQELI